MPSQPQTHVTSEFSGLELFHPIVSAWFVETYGRGPTNAQQLSWPRIAAGEHVLVCAPTGSGKTLTAFLWAINKLISERSGLGQEETSPAKVSNGTGPVGERAGKTGRSQTAPAILGRPESVRVLYISPLKALNNDVGRNLLTPLDAISARFAAAGAGFADIRVAVRSGDTTQDERRRIANHPPEILITTPESLNLMLTTPRGRSIFGGLETVILDEIHALAGSKRGAHLISAIERLTVEAGEFQRIGLSATVRPLEKVAGWMGGRLRPAPGVFEDRKVSIVRSSDQRVIELKVRGMGAGQGLPQVTKEGIPLRPGADGGERRDAFWSKLVFDLKNIINNERSTLIFANSRQMTEKLTRLINEGESEPLAWSHHGSLSKEIRLLVEQRLKAGEIKAIVATSSLELGIDIGSLDRVVMVQTPFSASQTFQRIGRAGHQVGGISRAELIATHGLDFLYAATAMRMVKNRDIEPVETIDCPLDVLAQVILSSCVKDEWPLDELFDLMRQASCFANLRREHFDLTLDMLAGRYADTAIPELKPRIEIDRMRGTVKARENAEFLIYQSGGTIPDRGYFKMRIGGGGAVVGELDEEFVWERSLGDQFALGAQNWRIISIGANDVEVAPADPNKSILPFWKGGDVNKDFHSAEQTGFFLEEADKRLDDPTFAQELEADGMEADAVESLLRHLDRQKKMTERPLPGRNHLLIEDIKSDRHGIENRKVIFHAFWGGRVTKPLAMAMSQMWEREHGSPLDFFAGNECLLLEIPDGSDPETLLRKVRPDNIHSLLRERLERTGIFGALFRENAGRALLLPKGDIKRRFPLWLNRLRSKKLLESVMGYQDFPVLLETWRSCLEDEFDIENLCKVLDEIDTGAIRISSCQTLDASPFAENVVYGQTGANMYQDDTPNAGRISNLSDELFRSLIENAELRPSLPAELVADFRARLQAVAEGYMPETADELAGLLQEQVVVPVERWNLWLSSIAIAKGIDLSKTGAESASRNTALTAVLGNALNQALEVDFSARRAKPGPDAAMVADPREAEPVPRNASIIYLSALPRILRALGLQSGDLGWLQPLWTAETDAALLKWLDSESSDADGAVALQNLLLDWLSRQGPVTMEEICKTFALEPERTSQALEDLVASSQIVFGRLVAADGRAFFCEARVYERLLRQARRARNPSLPTYAAEQLPLFLAETQGLVRRQNGLDALRDIFDRLIGYGLPAELWETAVLSLRLRPYYPSWIDTLFQSYGLRWFGTGERRCAFAVEDELPLYLRGLAANPIQSDEGDASVITAGQRADGANGVAVAGAEGADFVAAVFKDRRPRSFLEIVSSAGMGVKSSEIAKALWSEAWKARVSSDNFDTVRRGVKNDFKVEDDAQGGRGGRRRWEANRPLAGSWFVLETAEEGDALDLSEDGRELARQVLRRYGVVSRKMLKNELPSMSWAKIFPSLRLMELSGELVTGHFFEGIGGPQFADQEALRHLRGWESDGVDKETVWMVNAADPASLCGLGVDGLDLPRRIASTWIVYQGSAIALVANREGRELDFRVDAMSPTVSHAIECLRFLLSRETEPRSSIQVETINGEPAPTSAFAGALKSAGFIADYKTLTLWRRF